MEIVRSEAEQRSRDEAIAQFSAMAIFDRETLNEAAAAAAKEIAAMNLSGQRLDEQLYVNTAQGRQDAGEESSGVDFRVSPREEFPDDGESSVPSAAPVKARYDTVRRDPDAARCTRPLQGQTPAFDDLSDIGAPTEAGVLAEEPPARGALEPPPSPEVDSRPYSIQPEFVQMILQWMGSQCSSQI